MTDEKSARIKFRQYIIGIVLFTGILESVLTHWEQQIYNKYYLMAVAKRSKQINKEFSPPERNSE